MRPFLSILFILAIAWACIPLAASAEQGGDDAGALPAQGDALLRRIAAAQAGREQVQGRFIMRTTRADDPTGMETVYHVDFWLSLPDRYHFRLQDATDPELIEWFISDGTNAWHAEQTFSDEPAVVSTKPVDAEAGGGFDRFADFFRLDLAALRRDFQLDAHTVAPQEGQPWPHLSSDTRHVVTLVTRAEDLAEHLRRVEIEFGIDLELLALHMTDGKDNRRAIVLQRLEDEVPIADTQFRWDGPEP